MTSDTFTCSRCGQDFPSHQRYDFDEAHLCPDCYDRTTVLCSHCGGL